MSQPAVLLSADLSSVMLVTDSSSQVWTAPSMPESPDAMTLRARIDEAAAWTGKQPTVKRRLSAAVLDISDATCRWVQSPSAAAPVVAATLRSQTEEWSARLPLGGIEPIIDELPQDRSFEFVRSRLESRSAANKRQGRVPFDPTNTLANESGARMAVIVMPDAMVRLWLDRMDRSGVAVDSVLTLWHALALSWGDENSEAVRAITLVDNSGRIVWAWASGTRLIVGGSLQLERPEAADRETPHRHRAESAAQRISLDWVTWSAQLGVTPDELLVVSEAQDPLADELHRSLSQRWDDLRPRTARSDHPIRETVARAAAAIRSVPKSDRGPRRCMSRLSQRPNRATRRRYLMTSVTLVLIAGAIAGLGTRLSQEGRQRYAQGAAVRAELMDNLSTRFPNFLSNQPISFQLREVIRELESAPAFVNPPAPRPIYEDMYALATFLEAEFPEAKIRRLKISQGGNPPNELQLDMPSSTARSELIARLPTLETRVAWRLRSTQATAGTLLDLVGDWRGDATP